MRWDRPHIFCQKKRVLCCSSKFPLLRKDYGRREARHKQIQMSSKRDIKHLPLEANNRTNELFSCDIAVMLLESCSPLTSTKERADLFLSFSIDYKIIT